MIKIQDIKFTGRNEKGFVDVTITYTENMIKATELRIGNWINYKERGLVKVVSISEDELEVAHEGVPVNWLLKPSLFDPIPLTPETLEAAGFKVNREFEYHDHVDIPNAVINYCKKGEQAGRFHIININDSNVKPEVCIYLHQLQNLYFVLTGEELTINLSTTN